MLIKKPECDCLVQLKGFRVSAWLKCEKCKKEQSDDIEYFIEKLKKELEAQND